MQLLLFFLTLFLGYNCDIQFDFKVENSFGNNSLYNKTIENETIYYQNVDEGKFASLSIKLTYFINDNINNATLSCRVDDDKVGYLVNWTDLVFDSSNGQKDFEFDVTVEGKRLGGCYLYCGFNFNNQTEKNLKEEKKIFQLIVMRVPTVHETIFRVIIIICLLIIVFAMGCALDRKVVWGYIKKPVSPAIGFSSQYVFMPLIAFGIAKLSGLNSAFGLGLLTIGCSPGGGASNIWTVLLHGDLNLSMTMTFFSTVAALFMMPFWMFLLSRFFIDRSSFYIPFSHIILTLVNIIVPVAFGMLFRYKCEKWAIWLAKKVKFMGLLFLVYILTYGTYVNLYIYKLMGDYPILIPIGACLPWTAFFFGTLFAFICRQNKAQCITVGLETGFQNIGIAILILKYSIPKPEGDMGATMPVIVALMTPLPLYFILVGILIKRKWCKSEKDKNREMELNLEEEDKMMKKDKDKEEEEEEDDKMAKKDEKEKEEEDVTENKK